MGKWPVSASHTARRLSSCPQGGWGGALKAYKYSLLKVSLEYCRSCSLTGYNSHFGHCWTNSYLENPTLITKFCSSHHLSLLNYLVWKQPPDIFYVLFSPDPLSGFLLIWTFFFIWQHHNVGQCYNCGFKRRSHQNTNPQKSKFLFFLNLLIFIVICSLLFKYKSVTIFLLVKNHEKLMQILVNLLIIYKLARSNCNRLKLYCFYGKPRSLSLNTISYCLPVNVWLPTDNVTILSDFIYSFKEKR